MIDIEIDVFFVDDLLVLWVFHINMFMYWILDGRVILILDYTLVTLEFADGFINVYETTYKCGKFLVAATTSERSGTSMDKSSHVEREWGGGQFMTI